MNTDRTETETVHIIISGHVQGVAYRASCRRFAQAHNVSGWVRNLPEGTVEVMAQGNPKNLQRLVAWCEKGPTRAVVDAIDVDRPSLKSPLPEAFTIK